MKLLLIVLLLSSCSANVSKSEKDDSWVCKIRSGIWDGKYNFKTVEEANDFCIRMSFSSEKNKKKLIDVEQ